MTGKKVKNETGTPCSSNLRASAVPKMGKMNPAVGHRHCLGLWTDQIKSWKKYILITALKLLGQSCRERFSELSFKFENMLIRICFSKANSYFFVGIKIIKGMELRKKLIWVKLWKLVWQGSKWNLLFLILEVGDIIDYFSPQAGGIRSYFYSWDVRQLSFWRRISHYQQDSR